MDAADSSVRMGSWRVVRAVWRDAWRRVLDAPSIAAGTFALPLVLAAPPALVLRGMIESHLGRSLMAGPVADGVSYDWWNEFLAQASGVGATFVPTIIGFAATLDNISSIMDGQGERAPLVGVIAAYLAIWTFLMGGIIDRYARQRSTGAYGFFAACGANAARLVRLAALAGLVYWWLFAYVHAWLFDELYVRATRDLAAERAAFAWRAGLYLAFGALLAGVNLLFDYAKIRLVVEDRRSALGAAAAAFRFIRRHPGRTMGMYVLNAGAFAAVIAIWALAAPGAGGAGLSMWIAFGASQLYVLARVLLKLQFIASETALFQASLAHATYTSAVQYARPDSPAVDAIGPRAEARG